MERYKRKRRKQTGDMHNEVETNRCSGLAQEKLTDLEGRSRRSNIQIWGLKEGVEGDSVADYVDNLIHKELGMNWIFKGHTEH